MELQPTSDSESDWGAGLEDEALEPDNIMPHVLLLLPQVHLFRGQVFKFHCTQRLLFTRIFLVYAPPIALEEEDQVFFSSSEDECNNDLHVSLLYTYGSACIYQEYNQL